jgi:hypothetical protein
VKKHASPTAKPSNKYLRALDKISAVFIIMR